MDKISSNTLKYNFKISVLICVYNEGLLILNALRSLKKNQLYNDTEILVVDDCSVDQVTLRILSLLEKFTSVKVIKSIKNLGLSNSRNLGFKNTTTPYVIPLDGDDTLPAGTIDIIYQAFVDNADADFIAGDYYLNNVNEITVDYINCGDIATGSYIDKLKLAHNWKLLGTSPCRKTLWEKIGGYNLKYSYTVQDVDFWIKALQYGAKGVYLNKPIYYWNKANTGMNANFNRLAMTDLLHDHQDFYSLIYTRSNLINRIFEGYYPYKDKKTLAPIFNKSFFRLNFVNKLRLLLFTLINIGK